MLQPTCGRRRERCRRGRAPRCDVRVRLLCYAPRRRRRWTTAPTRARTHSRERQRQRWEESFGRAGTTAANNARAPLVQGKIYKGLHTAAVIIHLLCGTLPQRNSNPAHQPPIACTPCDGFQPAADPCAVSAAVTGHIQVEIELPRNSRFHRSPLFQRYYFISLYLPRIVYNIKI